MIGENDGPTVPRETWLSRKLEIRSAAHGQGTFAVADIELGEVLEVWGEHWQGQQIVEYTTEGSRVTEALHRGELVMQWDDELFSIESRGADPGYFLNHSCDSNVWFHDAFTLGARRAITAGEELTLDYALFEADEGFEATWVCLCATPVCRRRLTGQDWRRDDLQRRYDGHFTPLLNKRIARLNPDPGSAG